LASVFLLMVTGCDSILPEKFKDKEYKSSGMDKNACYWLSLPDSLYDSLAGADTIWNDSTDNKIINAAFDRITDSLKTLTGESLLLVYYPAGEDTVYAVLDVSAAQAGSVNIYESLEYYSDDETNTTNINEYVSMELLTQDTSRVSSSSDLPWEALSDCSQEVVVAQHERVIPVIRACYHVQVASGVYLVRFILTNPVTIASFIGNTNNRAYYFKLVIL
jgi:hypothetical protein